MKKFIFIGLLLSLLFITGCNKNEKLKNLTVADTTITSWTHV